MGFSEEFKKFITNFLFVIWFILFVILAILIIFSTTVSAETTLDSSSQKLLDYYNNNLKSSFSDVIILDGWMITFNNTENNIFWKWQVNSNKNWLQCTNQANISTNMYIISGDNVSLHSTTLKFGNSSGCYDIGSSNINVTSVDIYSGYYSSPNTNSLLYPSNYYDFTFTPPFLLPNASTEQTQQDALTSGQFIFFIVNPR